MVLLCSTEMLLGCTVTEKNIECLMLICCGTLGVTKTILFRIYAKNLTDNYSSAVNDYKTIKNPRDYFIMRRHTYIGKLLFCCLLGSSYFSCFIIAAIPVLGGVKTDQNVTNETVFEYIVPSTCALEYFRIPTSMRTIVLIVQTLALFTTCNTYMVCKGNDTLFLSIVLHLCGQIKILNRKYVDLDGTSSHDRLIALIKRHIYLIRKANKLSETINIALLMQLFLLSIILCILGFQLILAIKLNNVIVIGKSLIMIFAFVAQLSLYSFIGDYLISQMEEIALSVYQSAWYKLSENTKRNVIFVIMRREFPVALKAGNFIMVNLSTYMNILKTSLSYLSVLRVMIET
ncbi:odorant receptor 30a-like [Pseudomyrmex gracilis]|uniref:odorant receptor 30a-like n=1 Tax=Pseudomyrmex gracilis TaxID=219809 RepID=UPI000995AA9D|nr:odorant receptor 30a-like [Pseudomyrmex gracilis]